jgi:hypothetical protein
MVENGRANSVGHSTAAVLGVDYLHTESAMDFCHSPRPAGGICTVIVCHAPPFHEASNLSGQLPSGTAAQSLTW